VVRPGLSSKRPDDFFLPDFCAPRIVLAVVLVSELLALTFSLVRHTDLGFFVELGRISILMQWLGLTSAALLCLLRTPLQRRSTLGVTSVVVVVVLANILLLSLAMIALGRWLGDSAFAFFPEADLSFILRNLAIGLIVVLLLLRYLFVNHEWQRRVETDARARIDALQARIRPHFLFNSMNTIAALTRSDPVQAEKAVEDLADLFRATLGESGRLLLLEEEIELSQIYQRIEQLRMGDRLHVDWDLAAVPSRARLPGLTIQPLLENAILHGIEHLPEGGTVTISGRYDGEQIEITISNPSPPAANDNGHQGLQMAVGNIRERLNLAFAGRASLDLQQSDRRYDVILRFPCIE
jgi:two-component system sensor histidine kinase AlgZ